MKTIPRISSTPRSLQGGQKVRYSVSIVDRSWF